MNFFNSRFRRSDEITVKPHQSFVYDLQAPHDVKYIFTTSNDKTAKMICAETGQIRASFEKHSNSVFAVASIANDVIATCSDDYSVILWCVSRVEEIQILKFSSFAWTLALLKEGVFMVGLHSGEIHIYQFDQVDRKANFVTRFQAHKGGINRCRIWQNRFATVSLDGCAKLWSSSSFECIAVFNPNSLSVRSVAFTNEYFMLGTQNTGSPTAYIYSLNELNASPKIVEGCKRYVRDIRVVNFMGEYAFMFCSDSGHITVIKPSDASVLWHKYVGRNRYALCADIVCGGRLVYGLNSGEVVISTLPDRLIRLVSIVSPQLPIARPSDSPLVHAFLKYREGGISARNLVDQYVNYDNCRISFEELCCAHALVRAAVETKEIEASNEYCGEKDYWYDNLYLAMKEIPVSNSGEYMVFKEILSEAKEISLIDSSIAVLTGIHLRNDLRKTERVIDIVGASILKQIACIEARQEGLVRAFKQYKQFRTKTWAVGIALQLIPIIGGVAAGVTSGGAEIIRGLSIKDVTDYTFSFLNYAGEGYGLNEGDMILKNAAGLLARDNIQEMDATRKLQLERVLKELGHNFETIRRLLLQFINWESDSVDEPHSDIDSSSNTAFQAKERSSALQSSRPDTTSEDWDVEDCEIKQSYFQKKTSGDLHECDDSRELDKEIQERELAELKSIQLSPGLIQKLSQFSISRLWAAYAVRFNEGNTRFIILRDTLHETLIEQEVFGSELCDCRSQCGNEFLDVYKLYIEEKHVCLPVGIRIRLEGFLQYVREIENSNEDG